MATDKKIAAAEFAQTWKNKGDEKQDTQRFWIDLFHTVFGVDNPTKYIQFEKRVKLEESTRFIDAYIPDTKVLIEQKGMMIDLSKPELQSGGASLTPYNQARRYDNNLPVHEKARWIVCCNFQRFEIHDMNNPLAEPEVILLENLDKDYIKLAFLADVNVDTIRKEEEISVKAGKIVGKLYDLILPQYQDPTNPETLKSLNQLCVRLVFCLYAEDTGLFGEKDKFYKYLSGYKTGQLRKALIELFEVFDTPYEDRDQYMDPDLASFPYIKGGIFTDHIEIPQFNEEIIDVLYNQASLEIDWSNISPTVFGAVFESTLNPETRHQGGMHYTSVENIHKVIDPLFLDSLKEELEKILSIQVKGRRDKLLSEFQTKLSSLKFLDPACGSGNFLTETYLSLRRLENKVLEALGTEGMLWLGDEFSPIKVKIDQFYGIEINDFAVSVARTALWIAESQTMKETEHIVGRPIEYFPLKENPNIVEGNALRVDWTEIISSPSIHYIMGNPPFVGEALRSKEQSDDMSTIFGQGSPETKLDYVLCWYKKARPLILAGTKVAFVSTNSICQGESVPSFWKNFLSKDIEISFAHKSFKWESEAFNKATVWCVIVGLQLVNNCPKVLFDSNNPIIVDHINAYLYSAPDIWLESRSSRNLSSMPCITKGSEPTDGGELFLSAEEKEELVNKYPSLKEYIRPFVGAKEYIHGKMGSYTRYCFWFAGASPASFASIAEVTARLKAIKELRLSSSADRVRKKADCPYLFCQIRQPDTEYMIIPRHTSSDRTYIPLGYLNSDVICGDANNMIPNASPYMFGVMESKVHMAWMKVVCGRLGMGYRYSPSVYNNFPWPAPNDIQKAKIEKTAQAILDARNLYPDCSLADLYDEVTMPPELRKAHNDNDKAVMEAYGFKVSMTESEVVAELFNLYKQLTKEQ